ncbi:beta-ketothiolase BktB [Corynebacterium guangdongense]|uniref:Probable acetyl-CoA acetyltransferase n=1 Tax=Corynebacterium guangdongense TaxID=1783348 RepID=A0ABU1ZTY5_9CORY|nr:beta-ketothiolase BktB [Corynebacterium guangdongense]MDR7328389.1 acetyl-CoA C-acetyltransferase [Corynebacterium guangdongense]WJZ16966.1 Beta-ketothiolase BktB [Corynebacterium guangdongense]
MQDVYIVSSARTAIGSFGGTLADVTPVDLGIASARAAVERGGVDPSSIDAAVYGHVTNTVPSDAYLSRQVAVGAGAPDRSHAMNVNRLCGSGAQAIVSATQSIREGDASVALAGGAESMSRAPYSVPDLRFGKRLGEGKVLDWINGALVDPFGHGHMGVTAENIVERFGITREQQDEFSLESQRRAQEAIAEGRFTEQIVPVEVPGRKETITFDTDEHPRATTLEKLGALKPVFKEGGTVTAGNASGMNDAAASLVLAGEQTLKDQSLTPTARVVSWGLAGCAPEVMGLGPVDAVPRALKKAGLSLDDIELIESNEAFAAQALAVQQQLGFDPGITNIDGGAVALGHPIGATGAILMVKIIHRLHALGRRYGLVTMCIGGGQGIALIVEAV